VARDIAESKVCDFPELPPDTRNREPARDLSARLGDLAGSHPSSADYVSDRRAAHERVSSAERYQRDSPAETSASADYAAPDEIQLTADRHVHIFDGDQTGGGHRHGTGRPGKTEFPAEWGDDRIADAIFAVARNPDQAPERQDWNGRWQVSGRHDGVMIYAVVESDGRVWSAWPDEGSPGVTKNPAAKNQEELS